ncbi:MAG: hypothetical protein M3Y03_03065, partial [Verrucomicrobiota bacterium]|nr:hypothetical protein [Verrucomicrobiota bacterium]
GDDDYSGVVRVLFPDGPPEKSEAETIEEQTTLSGLEHREAVAAPESETLEPAPAEENEPAIAREPEPVADEKKASDETVAPMPASNGHASTDEAATEADPERESVAAEAETEPQVQAQTPAAAAEAEQATRGGFLSRLFGKGVDY